MRIENRWFERRRIDDDITLIWEPYVDPLIRCNIWHVRGRDRDMLIDTGLGIASLRNASQDIFDKRLMAVATHTHFDHIGGMHEFDERVVHESEAAIMTDGSSPMMLRACDFSKAELNELSDLGYPVERDELITAVPEAAFDIAAHTTKPAPSTWSVREGDRIDLGNRNFEGRIHADVKANFLASPPNFSYFACKQTSPLSAWLLSHILQLTCYFLSKLYLKLVVDNLIIFCNQVNLLKNTIKLKTRKILLKQKILL